MTRTEPLLRIRAAASAPDAAGSSGGHAGLLAGVPVLSDLPLPLLRGAGPAPAALAPRSSATTHSVTAQLVEQPVQVRVCHAADGSVLAFPDGSLLWVDSAGQCIEVHAQGRQWLEVVLGPGLLLALARRGRWCWHASGFRLPEGGCWLALAASGVGKSTLACSVAAGGGRRLVDDLAVVSAAPEGSGLLLWPRLPQLKLLPEAHWPASSPPSVPLHGIALLARGVEAASADPLTLSELHRALLSHTVAARLFDPPTLAAHLAFTAAAAQQLHARGAGQRWLAATTAAPAAGWSAVWRRRCPGPH